VLEVALFRELGAFRGTADETWDGSGVTRFRFARGAVVLDGDGQVLQVRLDRRVPPRASSAQG
jgi:hypothetical protein